MSILFGKAVSGRNEVADKSKKQKIPKEQTPRGKITEESEEDYVCSLKAEDILENGKNARSKTPLSPGDVSVLDVSYKRLSDISNIDLCERLVFCNLSNNFLKDVSSLKWCVNLYCLDLHSNQTLCSGQKYKVLHWKLAQITSLPDHKCWSALKKLSVLYLHDNGIGKLDELRDLAHATKLIHLTLYDSPISLKTNYRHCVVNAIWSLKALDFWVVSDEEIIEDANFPPRFKPMELQFRSKPYYISVKENQKSSLDKYLSNVYKEVASINRIQSRYCPVLVIQRMVRGYLIRLRYDYVMDTRLWAAVSIQRCYRNYKGFPLPPPSTPLLHYQDFMYKSMSSIKLDYDAYVRMRRSIDPSMFSMKSVNFQTDWKDSELLSNRAIRTRISINLEQLMGKATQISFKEENASKFSDSSDYILKDRKSARLPSSHSAKQGAGIESHSKDHGIDANITSCKKDPFKIGKYYTQFKFLGEIDSSVFPDIDENVDFRLSVQKAPVMKHSQLDELVLRKVEDADDIRKAIKKIDYDRKKSSIKKTIPFKRKGFRKSLQDSDVGNMSFSCFHAIDKAYKDRAKMEKVIRTTHGVKQMKELEELSRERVKGQKYNDRNIAKMEMKKEKDNISECIAKQSERNSATLDTIDAKRNVRRETQKKKAENYQFALEFNCQNASIGKALANHDRTNRRDEETSRKIEHIDALRIVTEKKREIISSYVKSLKLARQIENVCMKRDLQNVISERASENFDQQVNRVESLKNMKGQYRNRATLLPAKQYFNPVRQDYM